MLLGAYHVVSHTSANNLLQESPRDIIFRVTLTVTVTVTLTIPVTVIVTLAMTVNITVHITVNITVNINRNRNRDRDRDRDRDSRLSRKAAAGNERTEGAGGGVPPSTACS